MDAVWIAAGVLLALSVGLALGVSLARTFEWSPETAAPASPVPAIDAADMESLIQDAAERWAMAHGRPEAAGLVADKLCTLHDLTYGRPVDSLSDRDGL
jgi:hypothetical protein